MLTFTHRNPEMQLTKARTALVLADIQNEFLQEKQGTYYELIADALKERNVVANLEQLLATAQELGYYVIHSPHYYYPTDSQWEVPPGAIGHYLAGIGFCARKDPVDLDGFEGSRADYFEPFKRYLQDGHTCNTAPHKHFGCEANDVIKQLRMRKVEQVIMAGPVANICLESHMRDIIEAGMEVAMVRDAVAAGVNEEGDGYAAAMVNYRFMANAVWTTEETVRKMKSAASV
ncbi:isochorismatase family protein [Acidisoma sp. L85]|uniref:isochorismatase family protein n=1 Tax=Acidisoma sp. L85 TaxID=1641850 RepID=UPI00131E9CB1|nr:isochorismatase family protein [Acidisoma sp. L85]